VEAARLSKETLLLEMEASALKPPSTAGERAFSEFGISGARGEAVKGFPSVTDAALPAFRDALNRGYSENDAGVYALLHLISILDDTCLIARGGMEGLLFAKQCAQKAILPGTDFMKEAHRMDQAFTERGLSPGGCADLLCAMKFLLLIEKTRA